MMKPAIYTASRMHHAGMWRELREQEMRKLIITARWIDQAKSFDEAQAPVEVKRQGWLDDEEDIRRSDYVLVYAKTFDEKTKAVLEAGWSGTKCEDGETLRGALVEAGMGIALGKRVVLCGESESFGTWQHHPGVRAKLASVSEALQWIMDDWNGAHTSFAAITATMVCREALLLFRDIWINAKSIEQRLPNQMEVHNGPKYLNQTGLIFTCDPGDLNQMPLQTFSNTYLAPAVAELVAKCRGKNFIPAGELMELPRGVLDKAAERFENVAMRVVMNYVKIPEGWNGWQKHMDGYYDPWTDILGPQQVTFAIRLDVHG